MKKLRLKLFQAEMQVTAMYNNYYFVTIYYIADIILNKRKEEGQAAVIRCS